MGECVSRGDPGRLEWRLLLLFLSLFMGVGGCDKLFKASKEKAGEAGAQPLTAAQTGVTPARPFVNPNDVLATVNGVPISNTDFTFRMEELKAVISPNQDWQPSKDQLDAILNELISTELMSQDAAARGLHRSLETQRRWEFLHRGFFAQEWLRWNQERLTVNSADVEQYYEQNKQGFRDREKLQLREIVVASEEQARAALARLLGESIDFAALAQQISLGPTAAQGGVLPQLVMRTNDKAVQFLSEEEATAAGVTSLDPSLEAAAFAIDQEGELSNYRKGADNQYHIFQLVKREPERQRPMSEVWDRLKEALQVQKLQQAIDGLNQAAKVERFPERLETSSPSRLVGD